ncbi:UDP-glucose 4-epimerase [Legionella massiliensis]|uniref:UDP-glucose 4-epimerase n=1 Tax=Legionella massiliensis TaxID=1034943 RepID=A0A078KT42_9GAMM|nr:NAD-dependent epimerase/dehydratase family protein [Legionella massiliensis]CDZ76236.1 UDP-glucose 4-epimerase [Legionella massiliensis]CEE11974.1 dTDP-4-dehydro-6-deoxyglucose reductase [Legionella massiliensis]
MKISQLNVLVLGGNGFVGSHLVSALVDEGHSVKVFSRSKPTYFDNINPQLQYIEGDITNDSDIAYAIKNSDICYHLASTVLPKSSNLDPIFDIETNLMATVRLLNQAARSGVKKVIFLSSGGTIYGAPLHLPIDENHPTNPICSYGITKLAIEKYLSLYHQLHGLDYIVLRLSNPFGEKQRISSAQGAIAVFLGKALRKEPIEIWGDGSVIRDYIHISDVISAMLQCIAYTGTEHVFNIGSGYGITLDEVLHEIEVVTGTKIERQYTPGRTFDVPVNILSIERAIQELKWKPRITFTEGLSRTMSWIKEAIID